jgi:hypothetical protein
MATPRKTKDLNFPSFCLGDLSYVDVREYLKHSDTILIPKASLEQRHNYPALGYVSQSAVRHRSQPDSSRLQPVDFCQRAWLERQSG